MGHGLTQAGAALRALAVAGMVLGAAAGAAQQPPQSKKAPAAAQTKQAKVDPDADRILRAMSSYLGGLKAFNVRYEVDNEAVVQSGEKLQFSASGEVAVQRPNKVHATRQGGYARPELFYDGQTVTLLGRDQNVYAQLSGPKTIDEALDALRTKADLDLAGADLLVADVYGGLMPSVQEGMYVGPAVVDGVECEHLAFRTDEVDWQLWVQRGDKPLPVKYVITSKWVAGAPQYSVRMHDWNVQPALTPQTFTFVPPAGAKKVDAIATNELGEPSVGSQK